MASEQLDYSQMKFLNLDRLKLESASEMDKFIKKLLRDSPRQLIRLKIEKLRIQNTKVPLLLSSEFTALVAQNSLLDFDLLFENLIISVEVLVDLFNALQNS